MSECNDCGRDNGPCMRYDDAPITLRQHYAGLAMQSLMEGQMIGAVIGALVAGLAASGDDDLVKKGQDMVEEILTGDVEKQIGHCFKIADAMIKHEEG